MKKYWGKAEKVMDGWHLIVGGIPYHFDTIKEMLKYAKNLDIEIMVESLTGLKPFN